MQRYVSLVFCLALFIRAEAQGSWIRHIALPDSTYPAGAALMPDGGVVLTGSLHYTAGLLMRTDPNGEVMWTHRYTTKGPILAGGSWLIDYPSNEPRTVTVDAQGTIVVGGTTGVPGSYTQEFVPTCLGFTPSGDSLWGGFLSDGRNAFYYGSAAAADGSALFCGNHSNLFGGYSTLRRVNAATGQVIAFGEWGASANGNSLASVASTADNGTLLAGYYDYQLQLIRTNADLTVRWDTLLTINGSTNVSNARVVEAADGGVFVTAAVNGAAALLKCDANGHLLWSLGLPGSTFGHVKALPDGGALLAGEQGGLAVVRFDADGSLVYAHSFQNTGGYTVLDLLVAPDSSFYVVGTGPGLLLVKCHPDGSAGDCGITPFAPTIQTAMVVGGGDPSLVNIGAAPMHTGRISPTQSQALSALVCAGDPVPYRGEGHAFYDVNANGTYEAGEPGLPAAAISASPFVGAIYAGADGAYLFAPPDSGIYQISAHLPGPHWQQTTSPDTQTVAFTANDTVFTGLDFGWHPDLDTTILTALYATTPNLRSGSFLPQWINCTNHGTTRRAGLLGLSLDPLLQFAGSDVLPDSVVGQTIYWHFDSLDYFAARQIFLQIHTPGYQFLGDTTHSVLRAWALENGQLVLADSMAVANVIAAAYDPNAKAVVPAGEGPNGIIAPDTPWLTYTVHFQNTGNGEASTVVVRDPLWAPLDQASLEVLGSSHPLTSATVDPYGLATFRFENIQLPDSTSDPISSQGFVSFRIRPRAGLPHPTVIQNTAFIDFDQNPTIPTPTVINTLFDCAQDLTLSISVTDGEAYVHTSAPGTYQWYFNGEPIPGATWEWYDATTTGFYMVRVAYPVGCVLFSDPIQIVVDGATELAIPGMAVLPNPSSAGCTLRSDEPLMPADAVALLDATGRTLLELRGDGGRTIELPRGSLSAGLYVLRIQLANGAVRSMRLLFE